MKSIQALFEKVQEQNPYWSNYTCLAEAVTNKSFTKDTISRAFNKYVSKNDCPESRVLVLKHLVGLTKIKHGGKGDKPLKSPTNDFSTEKHKSITPGNE